ncbi:MAG TPA: amidophosphoribosyltransferase [Firmicutes bacterium]|jgi:amidophosphoribosyltransferase|nr:amidophosphoribosyltransferase [Candidatus Fermentithermobacillaceae bacterium]
MGLLRADEIREHCGVFAVVGHPKASELCYYGLYALQHRGQESAGMAVRNGSRIQTRKGMGLVSDVFSREDVMRLEGSSAVAHVRYSNIGDEGGIEDAQPIAVKMWQGQMSFAHNGNLINAARLRTRLEQGGSIFQTTSDCEVIPHLMAKSGLKDLVKALIESLPALRGAYSLCVLTPNGIIAAKDPNGFRPLCLGRLGGAYIVCSETCALDAVGAEFIRELAPGEAVFIEEVEHVDSGSPCAREPVWYRMGNDTGKANSNLCVFEFIYFARPDSDIYGINVHAARKALGRRLAMKDNLSADLVTGIPDSSLSAASGYAEEAGIPYEMGIVKNKYIGRTFIAPRQSLRELGVKIKINPLQRVVSGRRVVLVDDSMVRGTTSKYIVSLLRAAGAKEVHVRISSPPYKFPCYYGIDTSSRGELIAVGKTEEQIRDAIGADSIAFLDVHDLEEVLGWQAGNLCTACFTGDYPVALEGDTCSDDFR